MCVSTKGGGGAIVQLDFAVEDPSLSHPRLDNLYYIFISFVGVGYFVISMWPSPMVDSHMSYHVSPRTMACERASHTECRLLGVGISMDTAWGNLRGHACTEDPPLHVRTYSVRPVVLRYALNLSSEGVRPRRSRPYSSVEGA